MRPLIAKIKPVRGTSAFLHYVLVCVFPVLVFLLVRRDFVPLAALLIILSKWRMFAVRPRFWLANIRANAIDIIFGIAIMTYMTQTGSLFWQIIWVVVYELWLVVLKPRSGLLSTSAQALVGFFAGLMALYLALGAASAYQLVLATGLLCYLAARHFFDSFDEPYARLLAYTWGYFGAALAWLLSHWLLFYGPVSQVTVLLVSIGVGLAALYYFDHFDRLTPTLRRQCLFVMSAVIILVLALSNWGNKIV
jgi:hypothetical protein